MYIYIYAHTSMRGRYILYVIYPTAIAVGGGMVWIQHVATGCQSAPEALTSPNSLNLLAQHPRLKGTPSSIHCQKLATPVKAQVHHRIAGCDPGDSRR